MNKQRTLLHVDDDDSIAFLFQQVLQKEGFNYQRAKSVDEAIAYIGNLGRFNDTTRFPQPDVIITDLALSSGKSALEFIIWLRHHPQHGRTPIVVLTGGTEPETEERVMRAGANAFVMKGVTFKELLAQLRAIFHECGVM